MASPLPASPPEAGSHLPQVNCRSIPQLAAKVLKLMACKTTKQQVRGVKVNSKW